MLLSLMLMGAVVQLGAATSTQTVSAQATKPPSAMLVPQDFVGFGFETAFLDNYNNDFSENLINSVASRMGAPPIIRVGGTTGDNLHVDLGQTAATQCLQSDGGCPWSSSAKFIVGPSYFDTFSRFLNARMTFQIPLGPNVNATNIQEYARLAYQALGSSRTAAIALGNEVGGYDQTAQAYVTGALAAEKVVVSTLNLTGSAAKIFEVADLASVNIGATRRWTIADAFAQGLNQNGQVKTNAEHWYQLASGETGGMQVVIMNHTAVLDKFKTYASDVAFSLSHGIPFALSETGDALTSSDQLAPYFGGALWAVDFQLYSASRGVSRVDGSQRPQAPHSLWVPIAGVTNQPGPQVRAPFYASPFVADFIGKTNTASITNIDLGSDELSAYAAYEGNGLKRIALVNMMEWSVRASTSDSNSSNAAAAEAARPTQIFALPVPAGTSSVQVARLHADAGAFAGGIDYDKQIISYAGQQWSYSVDQGKGHGTVSLDTVAVQNGIANIQVPASEAVIVYV